MVDYSYSVISYSSQICKISKMEQESQKHSTKKNFQNLLKECLKEKEKL